MVCATHSQVRARSRSPSGGVLHLDLQQLPAQSNTRPPLDETWIAGDRQQQCCTSVSVVGSCTGVPSYTRSPLLGQRLGDECMGACRMRLHDPNWPQLVNTLKERPAQALFCGCTAWPRVWAAEPHAHVFEGCARSGQQWSVGACRVQDATGLCMMLNFGVAKQPRS
jgi:hypothetical protein